MTAELSYNLLPATGCQAIFTVYTPDGMLLDVATETVAPSDSSTQFTLDNDIFSSDNEYLISIYFIENTNTYAPLSQPIAKTVAK